MIYIKMWRLQRWIMAACRKGTTGRGRWGLKNGILKARLSSGPCPSSPPNQWIKPTARRANGEPQKLRRFQRHIAQTLSVSFRPEVEDRKVAAKVPLTILEIPRRYYSTLFELLSRMEEKFHYSLKKKYLSWKSWPPDAVEVELAENTNKNVNRFIRSIRNSYNNLI